MKKIIFPFLLSLVATLPLSGCSTVNHHSDKHEYEKYYNTLTHLSEFRSELYLFPSVEMYNAHIDEVNAFHYMNIDGFIGGDYFIFVDMKFNNADDYLAEKERILNVKATFSNGETKEVFHDENSNQIFSICNDSSKKYEYVCYDDDNLRNIYVSNQYFELKDTPLNSDYFPHSENIVQDETWGFNIYYYVVGDVAYYVIEEVIE